MKQSVLIIGAGRMGRLIATLLQQAKYHVILADIKLLSDIDNVLLLDVTDSHSVDIFLQKNSVNTIISCLPYFLTATVARIARFYHLNYFDLTEDIHAAKIIKQLAKNAATAFVPHCGVAPGLVCLFASHLIQEFSTIDTVRLRVGGLPRYAHNALHYAITWSIDGLINEYGNSCQSISYGKISELKPLDDIEELEIDGMQYEAFNTSGGLGNLIDLYAGKVQHLNYKTIRYPGHCEKMRFLVNDLKLNENRTMLKSILENAIPETDQDVVIVDVSVIGKRQSHWHEASIVKKYYPVQIANKTYPALQITTAAAACMVIDEVLKNQDKYQGFIYQEEIPFSALQKNPFFIKYL